MKAIITLNDRLSVPRLSQMTQKTNQFNLTTIRYSETDLLNFVISESWRVYSLQLVDKFGDNGIVGEIIIQEQNDTWEINSFLLSCGVIGRIVETAFLAYVIEEGRKANLRNITGKYIPTKKNHLVKDLYKNHGFEFVHERGGTTIWNLDVGKSLLECPDWIRIEGENS